MASACPASTRCAHTFATRIASIRSSAAILEALRDLVVDLGLDQGSVEGSQCSLFTTCLSPTLSLENEHAPWFH